MAGFSPMRVTPKDCLHPQGVKPWTLKGANLKDQGLPPLGQTLWGFYFIDLFFKFTI
jgi:hypothetical protein